MVSLIVHALLGVLVVGLIVLANPSIFARPARGPALELERRHRHRRAAERPRPAPLSVGSA